MNLSFLGAAGTVTGSKYLLETRGRRYLVDCGLFQGLKSLRLQNWAALPFDPRSIDAVLLTHAHLDHSGYLPILGRAGFAGPIHCTPPTRELAKLILEDSARIQEEDAEHANQAGFSKHHPAKPLYDSGDVSRIRGQFKEVKNEDWIELDRDLRFRMRPNGHILGSVSIELDCEGRRIVFSGDLGRKNPLLLNPPAPIEEADYVVVESTYGNREHIEGSALDELARIVIETMERKGHLLIPSFSVGRAQDLLYLFHQLKSRSRIPDIPIFLDSPMGVTATDIFISWPEWHRLPPNEIDGIFEDATLVRSKQQSKEIMGMSRSIVVIAGSGMVTGGRILHHLANKIGDSRTTVLLVGYQAAGTRGRALLDGATEIKLHGHYFPVRAKIEEIKNLSAHADQSELLDWLAAFRRRPPKKVFVVHGEPEASDALRRRIQDSLGWECEIPEMGKTEDLQE